MPQLASTISRCVKELPRRVHTDERGSISIVTVFTLLMFTMILVMIVNVGTHIDDKLKMQNASDAATYSGGVVLARGMNGLAFSNHLLSDVFAMTAFLREGRDRNAESLVPPVLDAWTFAGETLARAEFPKFAELGPAIVDKVFKEQEAVTAYGELTAAASELSLPVFEHILADQLIGEFQRSLLQTVPELAQSVTDEVARRHGLLGPSSQEGSSELQTNYELARGSQRAILWRTTVLPVALGDESDPLTRTMPVVDPDPFQNDYPQLLDADVYLELALRQRRNVARRFLNDWNFDRLRLFNHDARMSAYFHLWRIATCGQLERLLNIEYPVTNVPMLLRFTNVDEPMERLIRRAESPDENIRLNRRRDADFPWVMNNLRDLVDLDGYIEDNFHFVGVTYRRHRTELGPGLFTNPLKSNADAQTFSQISLFIPRPRKRLIHVGDPATDDGDGTDEVSLGGTFGFTSQLEVPRNRPPAVSPPDNDSLERVLRERWLLENYPTHWDLLNQNWMVQLIPATAQRLPEILQTNPGGDFADVRLPNFGEDENNILKRVNTH
ncbi:MAG: Tad domain-containing protein [Planctomycetota bacterium]|nr:Tad domain-containing protein [Planctomycetota bacterium]MDA0919063.1 Tad domain-containing protein [Planctomycetota bacterium]